jgi:hypothetical protein
MVCRDRLSGVSMMVEAPPKERPQLQAAAPAAHTAAAGGRNAPAGGAGGGPERPFCPLCRKLGIGGDLHKPELCFIDPKSKMYRPEVRQRKLETARRLGKTIPPELLRDDKPRQQNMMEAAYSLVGMFSQDPEVRERLVDELLETSQLEEGGLLLGSITHISDGDLPQEVEMDMGSTAEPLLSTFGRSTLAHWVDMDELGDGGDTQATLPPGLRHLAESLLRLIGPVN